MQNRGEIYRENRILCGNIECDTGRLLPQDTEECVKELRQNGWGHSPVDGWICPSCVKQRTERINRALESLGMRIERRENT